MHVHLPILLPPDEEGAVNDKLKEFQHLRYTKCAAYLLTKHHNPLGGDRGRMSDNLRTLGAGGAPAIPILNSVIGTAGNPKRPSVAATSFFSAACLLACKTTNQ